MEPEIIKRYAILLVVVIAAALLLSLVWHVPYVYTLIGFSVWAFVGHMSRPTTMLLVGGVIPMAYFLSYGSSGSSRLLSSARYLHSQPFLQQFVVLVGRRE